jgi:hypothetical protein
MTDTKQMQKILLICGTGTVLLISSLLVGPVEGYYRSRGVTWLDSESKGYLRLLDGHVYCVNIRKHAADCSRLGHYTVSALGRITVFDEISARTYQGRITFWGIWWDHKEDLAEHFTHRAFVGKSYARAAALPDSLFGKPLTEFWMRSLDKIPMDIVQPPDAPVISLAVAKYAMEHSELIDPSLPEVRHNALPLVATVRFLYGEKRIEKRRFEIYSNGSTALGFYSEGSYTSVPAVFRCRLAETSSGSATHTAHQE